MYDFMNRLVRRTTSGGDVIDIAYSADGDRVEKRVNGVSIYYHVDRNNLTGYAQVIEELDSSLTVVRSYTYGLDLIAQDQITDDGTDWSLNYYLYDGLGSVRGLADSSGLVTDAYFYDAWGNLINTAGASTANSYLFTGEQYDADLGMYFLRARYLNLETGRFHTLDIYEGRTMEPQTLHKYLYVHASPTMFVDPSGNMSLVEIGAVGAIIGLTLAIAHPDFRTITDRAVDTLILIFETVVVAPTFDDFILNNDEQSSDGAVEGLTSGSDTERDTSGPKIVSKPGGKEARDEDFGKAPGESESKEGPLGEVKVKTLPDGSKIISRASADGRPTIQIQRPKGKRDTEIRYNE